jgi:hypothetical protein
VASGIVRVGDEVSVLPSGMKTRITGIHTFAGPQEQAIPQLSYSLTVADEIDTVSMAAAIELVGWFKYETRRVYSLLAESETERAIRQADDRLAAFVVGQGGSVAVRDVIAGCRWIEDADAAERALQRLVAAGRGRWTTRPTTDRGGRPTRLFVLDAEAASAQPPRKAGIRGSADADAGRGAELEASVYEGYVEL